MFRVAVLVVIWSNTVFFFLDFKTRLVLLWLGFVQKWEGLCVLLLFKPGLWDFFFFFLGRISYIFLSDTRFIYLSVCFVFQSCCLSPANLHTACGHNFSKTAATEALGTTLDFKLRSDCESYVPTSYWQLFLLLLLSSYFKVPGQFSMYRFVLMWWDGFTVFIILRGVHNECCN